MSPIRAFVMILAIMGLCTGGLSGQNRILRDAAAAASGGTAGVAAGQQVGKEISPIFGKVSAATAKAAGVEGVPKTPVMPEDDTEAPPEAVQLPEGVTGPVQPLRPVHPVQPTRPKPVQRAATPRPSAEPNFDFPAFSSAPVPSLTKDDLASVDKGLESDQLFARLGRPAAHVIIPEDGQLRELYLFSGGGMHLGTVELTDGAVSAVNISRF